MIKNIQVLVPMSGQGTRYKKAGYSEIKPFIKVNGTSMLERLIQKVPSEWPSVFVMADNHKDQNAEAVISSFRKNPKIFYVPQNNTGPLAAIEEGLKHLNENDPVLVLYCDFGLKWDPWDFALFVERSQSDACLLSYRGFHAHYNSPQMYAYAQREGERVVEVKEKGSFTSNRENEFASCGGYYFSSVKALRSACEYQRNQDIKMNGEFYTSLTVEAFLRQDPQRTCTVYEIDEFYQWGTPQDLRDYEYWEKTFSAFANLKNRLEKFATTQMLMPMAGLGSRIRDELGVPKPFLTIDGLPMYRRALESFPRAFKTVFVTLDEVKSRMQLQPQEEVVYLEKTPPGQALSTRQGLSALDPNKDLIVTACDHSVSLSKQAWENFLKSPNCDAAIFTMTGFPGVEKKPESFSYVTSEADGPFPKVKKVFVKERPKETSSLLVGTFWFKGPSVVEKGIQSIIEKDLRVNGELYLDAVFNELIEAGLVVREIPLDGYINWGDTQGLREALYWYESFMGHKIVPRVPYPGTGVDSEKV